MLFRHIYNHPGTDIGQTVFKFGQDILVFHLALYIRKLGCHLCVICQLFGPVEVLLKYLQVAESPSDPL